LFVPIPGKNIQRYPLAAQDSSWGFESCLFITLLGLHPLPGGEFCSPGPVTELIIIGLAHIFASGTRGAVSEPCTWSPLAPAVG